MKNFLCAILILAAGLAHAGPTLLGVPSEPGSLAPALSNAGNDELVLTWLERVEDRHVLRFSVFDGQAFGPPGEIAGGKEWFANWADTPGLYVLPGGQWLAHWLVSSGSSVYAYDVVMSVSEDRGKNWSEPFSPHDDGTPTEHGFVSYYPAGPDAAGVVWLDGRETLSDEQGQGDQAHEGHGHHHGHGGAMTLRTARVSASGEISEPALLDEKVCDCCQTASAMTENGPLVIYRGRTDDELRDIWMVRGTDTGWSEPELLHKDGWQIGGCPVNGPALIAREKRAVAAWFTMADNRPLVRLALSEKAGHDFEPPREFSANTAMGRVDLAWLDDDFVMSWMAQETGGAVLHLARFDQQGRKLARQSLDGLAAERISGVPRIAPAGEGRLLVVWTAPGESGSRVKAALLEPDSWSDKNDLGD
jgi:hypothetical protein